MTNHHTHDHSSHGACAAPCRHKPAQPSKYRLPRSIVPSRYVLTIESDPDSPDFSGQVAIAVHLNEAVDSIKINSLDLELSNVRLSRADGTSFTAAVSYERETEMAELSLDGTAGSGDWQLALDFKGQVGNESSGLFCATKTDNQGLEQKILCTQLEAAEARRVFPCFDEPDFKATFQVNLILPRHHMALANGNGVCSEALPGNRKLVQFEETVLMSSYLVCFTLGPIVSSDPVLVNGKELRIWSLPGNEEKTKFALEVAAFGLDYFERYFGIPYPNGDKLDLVAIPGFAWGGMENVGLVICAEYVLLVADNASADEKQAEARIILHELAHQWFGDYVTMRWWNGLWLNESFATFMASKACQAWNPDIDEWEMFCSGREKAYNFDSLKNTHPIEETVANARDAIFLVDPISYEKGCSVLLQFEQFLGEEIFRQGISTYLKRHAFGNTEASDLWDSLEDVCREDKEAATLPIRQIMDVWIKQSGHPEIFVGAGKQPGTFKLSQRPFRLLDIGRKSGRIWPIPVTIAFKTSGTGTTGDGGVAGIDGNDGSVINSDLSQIEERKLLLTRKNTLVDLRDGGKNDRSGKSGKNTNRSIEWLKVNAGGSGFYRVRYSKELLTALTADIDKNLSRIEQHNLLADASAYLEAGIITSAQYFELLQKFVAHTANPDWGIFTPHFQGLYSLLDEVGRKRFRNMLAATLKSGASKSGIDPSVAPLPFVQHWRLYNLNLSAPIQKASLLVYQSWQSNPQSVSDGDTALAAMILGFSPAKTRQSLDKAFSAKAMDARHATTLEMQTYLWRVADLWAQISSRPATFDVYDLFASALLDHSTRRNDRQVEAVLQNWTAWTGQKKRPATSESEPESEHDEQEEVMEPAALSQTIRGLYGVDDAEDEAKLRALFKKYPYAPLKKEVAKALERIRAGVLMRQRESSAFSRRIGKSKKAAA